MTHLPFIAGAYALGLGIPVSFSIMAAIRARTTRRRLAAVEAVRS